MPSALHLDRETANEGPILGNISGAVMANKKLSVILKREKDIEGVKRQWQGEGECFVLSLMDSVFDDGLFSGGKHLVGGMWWASR